MLSKMLPTSKLNFFFLSCLFLAFVHKQVWKYKRIVIVVIFHEKLLVSNEILLWSTVYTMNNLFISENEGESFHQKWYMRLKQTKGKGFLFIHPCPFLDFMSRKQLIFQASDIDTINYCKKMKNISSLKITRLLFPLLLHRLAVQYILLKHQSSKPQLTSYNCHVPTMEMNSFSLSFLYLSKTYFLSVAFILLLQVDINIVIGTRKEKLSQKNHYRALFNSCFSIRVSASWYVYGWSDGGT